MAADAPFQALPKEFAMVDYLRCSSHAVTRQGQRNISEYELMYVLKHGTYMNRTGVTFVVLRRRDIPANDYRFDRWARLEGTVVVLGDYGTVVTVYRNRRALRDIRKKQKHRVNRGCQAAA